MKISFLSDTHMSQPSPHPADLLIHCGDLTGTGTVQQFKKLMPWLKSLRAKHPLGFLFVPGNHELGLDPAFVEKEWVKYDKDPFHNRKPAHKTADTEEILDLLRNAGITVLIDQAIEIEGVKFYGSPYTPEFKDWAFIKTFQELSVGWGKIPWDTKVLITHGPPRYIRDLLPVGEHVGDEALARKVFELPELKLHAFGHIHPDKGHRILKDKIFLNVSYMVDLGDQYGYAKNPDKLTPLYVVDTQSWEIHGALEGEAPYLLDQLTTP